jgi:uncharacterized protein (TIGR02285 family)
MKYIFLIAILLFSSWVSTKQPSEEELFMLLVTVENFIEQIKSSDDLSPSLLAHKLLFDEIGLPENLIYVPQARSQKMLNEEKSACVLFKVKTKERVGKYLFSKPIVYTVGRRLYQGIHSKPIEDTYLNNKGELMSLSELMNSRPEEFFLHLPAISYGDLMDQQISEINEFQKITRLGGELHNSQAKMFFKNRADFVLMFSPELIYYEQRNPGIKYHSYPIKNMTDPVTVHIMCNNTPASSAWLNQVDTAINKISKLPAFSKPYENTYTPDEVDMIKKMIDND